MNPFEAADFSAFRSSILPLFGQEFNKRQGPIYDQGKIASTLQDIQQPFSTITDKVANALAARGALGSGQLGSALTGVGIAQAGQMSKFLASLPFMEEQARRSGTGQLLGQMVGFAGRSPVGYNRTQSSAGGGAFSNQSSKQGTSKTTQQGGSFGSNFAGSMAGSLGQGSFDSLFGMLNPQGGGNYLDPLGGAPLGVGGQSPDFGMLPTPSFGGGGMPDYSFLGGM